MKKFKKILSAVSAAVLCALPMVNGVASNAANESTQLSQGTYRIYFDVNANSGIKEISFAINFNNMIALETKTGTLGGSVNTGNVETPNYIQYGGVYTNNGILTSPGTVFTVKLLASSDAEVQRIHTSAFDSSLKLMSSDSVTTEMVLVGDVNEDGTIDIVDVVSINSYIANPSKYPLKNLRAADVNGDGIITKYDSTMIQQYVAEIIPHF